MRLAALVAYAAAAVVTLTACGNDESGGSVRHDWDGAWVLTSGTHQGDPLELVASHPVTLVLDGDAVSGISACNHYGGTITGTGDSITVGAMSMTEMACSPESAMTLEAVFHAALAEVTNASLDSDSLTLSGDAVELVFARQAPVPTADLVGTNWILDTLVTGDTASSVMGQPTLLLRADGTVSGSTGCRTFSGTWVQTGERLEFPEFALGKRACSPALTPQDDHVVSVLDGGFTAAVDGPMLTVSDPDGSRLIYRAQS